MLRLVQYRLLQMDPRWAWGRRQQAECVREIYLLAVGNLPSFMDLQKQHALRQLLLPELKYGANRKPHS